VTERGGVMGSFFGGWGGGAGEFVMTALSGALKKIEAVLLCSVYCVAAFVNTVIVICMYVSCRFRS
jgi:hypothetical protein